MDNENDDVMFATENLQYARPMVLDVSFEKIWKAYREWIREPSNRMTIMLLEESVGRILWFIPYKSEPRWRQIIWGVLQLHRLAFDLALEDHASENSYGTTIETAPDIPANRLRIALTVLQSLWPVSQELVRASDATTTLRRQAKVRLCLESIRFVLRLILLSSYWKQIRRIGLVPGLSQLSGLYNVPKSPTADQEQLRRRRLEYIGRRTGRRVVSHKEAVPVDSSEWKTYSVIFGEFLYIFRPLFLTVMEARNTTESSQWRSWFQCLVMDITSLVACAVSQVTDNSSTRSEIQRRKVRLLLYLLRSPVWERYTEPAVDSTSHKLALVPVFGGITSSYLQEWVYYWKIYRCEEN